ncbi:acyl-CoA dehydrogenase family protein [Brachybacterium saurashtrense]|uniref:Dibenzothiophene monooxygenase n=1 Tax=Brachybacterium saurashtrense TaxID=556288 RepID=A0A345YR07_9MICO|nr:acyl-CoA dehydrogenase family protein [Brachybacterium saurashtrense]AXK46359.1 acyl-CoA dehydrogenase [Brachybacterium saurashtrense]RRR24099.1 acyl-CoA dehydrogenase [Brachybacterium saurashtrense]
MTATAETTTRPAAAPEGGAVDDGAARLAEAARRAAATPAAQGDHAALRERFAPLLAEIAAGAPARDRERRLPHAEVRALAEAGFTAVTVPAAHGGHGAGIETFFRLLIDLGEADSNLPQLLRAHFSHVEELLGGALDETDVHRLEAIARGDVIGNASHERSTATVGDLATTVVADGDGYRLDGEKHYSTGSLFADWIDVSARTEDGGRARVTVAADAPGVTLRDDWDGFGQILTGSGSSLFEGVHVPAAQVRVRPRGGDGVPTTQTSFLQLVLLSSLVGAGRAALRDAVGFVRSRTRVYSQGSGATAAQDPLVQQVIGRLSARVAAAEDAVLAAARALETARSATGEEREALIDAAELRTIQAQLTSVPDVLAVTTELFEVGGASATSTSRALDRHWRNARTLASHNPVIYQERAIGDRLLNGTGLLYFWSTGETPAKG